MAREGILYKVQHLYNAVIEFLLFVIVLIETQGPKRLDNLQKHVRFYKLEVAGFINAFSGKDRSEKLLHMLLQVTSIFYSKNGCLFVSDNRLFKNNIFEDLLVSKLVDLVLRGVSNIKDLCRYINLDHLIYVDEKSLLSLLKSHPRFCVHSDSSRVSVLEFHGLLGFDSHVYETIRQYFVGYLQSGNCFNHRDIKIHSRCIPLCCIRNAVMVFCVLHVSKDFKLSNSKLYLQRTHTRYGCSRFLMCREFTSSLNNFKISYPPIFLTPGKSVKNCSGKIEALNSSCGVILGAFFIAGKVYIFRAIFDREALKRLINVTDLRNLLRLDDSVSFDAVFCKTNSDAAGHWIATRVKAVAQMGSNVLAKETNLQSYVDEIELTNILNHPLSCSCTQIPSGRNGEQAFLNQDLHFYTRYIECPLDTLKFLGDFRDFHQAQIESFDSLFTESESSVINEKEYNSVSSKNHLQPLKQTVNSSFSLKDNIYSAENKEEFLVSATAKDDIVSKEMQLIKFISQPAFLLGDIKIFRGDEGIASAKYCDKHCDIYFRNESILLNKTERKAASKAVFFVPCISNVDGMVFASFVYLLDEGEQLTLRYFKNANAFATSYILPQLKSITSDCKSYALDMYSASVTEERNKIPQSEFEIELGNFVNGLDKVFKLHGQSVLYIKIILSKMHNNANSPVLDGKKFIYLFKRFFQYFSLNRNYSANFIRNNRRRKHICKRKSVFYNNSRVDSKEPFRFFKRNGEKSTECYDFYNEFHSQEIGNPMHAAGRNSCFSNFLKEDHSVAEQNLTRESFVKDSFSDKQHIATQQLTNSIDVSDGELSTNESLAKARYTSEDEAFFSCKSSPLSSSDSSIANISDSQSFPSVDQEPNAEEAPSLKSPNMCYGVPDRKKTPRSTSNIYCKHLYIKRNLKFKHGQKRMLKQHRSWNDSIGNVEPIETTAQVLAATKQCLLLGVKHEKQSFCLTFPKYLVPKQIVEGLRLSSILRVLFVPNSVIHMSYIVSILPF